MSGYWLSTVRVRRLPKHQFSAEASKWASGLLRALGVRLSVSGSVPPTGELGQVFVSNHVSWMDPLVMTSIQAMRFVAKRDLAGWPVLGAMLRASRAIYIQQDDIAELESLNARIRGGLSEADCIGFFPEATTTAGHTLLPFRTALFQPACELGAAVIPIAIRYRGSHSSVHQVVAWIGDEPFRRPLTDTLRLQRIVVDVSILEPISTLGRTRTAVALECEQRIRAALQIREPAKLDLGAEPKSPRTIAPPVTPHREIPLVMNVNESAIDAPNGSTPKDRQASLRLLSEIVARNTNRAVSDVTADKTLEQLGVDSLGAVPIIYDVEEAIGFAISSDELTLRPNMSLRELSNQLCDLRIRRKSQEAA